MQRAQLERWRHTTVDSGDVTCFLGCISVPRLYIESVFAAEMRLDEN
jgi:hypothetical protein